MKIKDEYKLKKTGTTTKEIEEIAHQWYAKYNVPAPNVIKAMRERYGVELEVSDLTWT